MYQLSSSWSGSPTRLQRHAAPQRKQAIARSSPKWNPQNVDNPVVMPNASFAPRDAVEVQLKACSRNDQPWTNHGIQTMYEFAQDAGSMELSWYFVRFRKDLYHFDHFMGGFSTHLGALVDCQAWNILEERADYPQPGAVQVDVAITDSQGSDAGIFTFTLTQRQLGSKKGCWMTQSLGRKVQ